MWLDMEKESELEMLRAMFLKAYASVPDKLREDVIAVIGGKPYSWNAAFVEVNGKTPLGSKIIKKLEEIGMFKDG
jgi:hypothetical protein